MSRSLALSFLALAHAGCTGKGGDSNGADSDADTDSDSDTDTDTDTDTDACTPSSTLTVDGVDYGDFEFAVSDTTLTVQPTSSAGLPLSILLFATDLVAPASLAASSTTPDDVGDITVAQVADVSVSGGANLHLYESRKVLAVTDIDIELSSGKHVAGEFEACWAKH